MEETLHKMVNAALDDLYQYDSYLITHNLHEQSITFRFALYLHRRLSESQFSEYNLDLEYNKNGNDLKIVRSKQNGARPDLILHKRGNNENNILIIEFKKYHYRRNDDSQKIKDFMDDRDQFRFRYGAFIVLGQYRDTVKIYWE